MKAGVLALQGAFREHREVLTALDVDVVEVRVPHDLDALDALFLPGGESTTMTRLLETSGLRAPLSERLADGLPTFATCAGLILLARDVLDGRADQEPLRAIGVAVRRNAYGTQSQSFEAPIEVDGLAERHRAPAAVGRGGRQGHPVAHWRGRHWRLARREDGKRGSARQPGWPWRWPRRPGPTSGSSTPGCGRPSG